MLELISEDTTDLRSHKLAYGMCVVVFMFIICVCLSVSAYVADDNCNLENNMVFWGSKIISYDQTLPRTYRIQKTSMRENFCGFRSFSLDRKLWPCRSLDRKLWPCRSAI